MRPLLILSAFLLLSAVPASAQVTVDLHALQALPERRPAPATIRPATALPPRPQPAPPQTATASAPPVPVPPAPQPALPEAAPDVASVTPVAPRPTPPPPPPPVADNATTSAAATGAGLRVTFAPGQSDLSPDSAASIKTLTATAPAGDSVTFNVLAYAPGAPDDASTARRVSLARAMAVRTALLADGVPSARIFVRALGAQYGDGPPDRVDVNVLGGNDPAAAR
jgi:outer membrane protein OmpA-like peptidoglycan-associated protein